MPNDTQHELERLRSLRKQLEIELTEASRVRSELLELGQMQMALIVCLENMKGRLPISRLNDIQFAPRKTKDLDNPVRQRLAAMLRKGYQQHGLPVPDLQVPSLEDSSDTGDQK